MQYKDYAYWQKTEQNSERMLQQEQFWLGQLQGELPVLELPTDHPRKEISSVSGGRFKFDLPQEEKKAVELLGKQFGATNFIVLLTGWYVLLARYSAQDDIIIGSPVSGRTLDDTREMIGMFVNMLALRNYPSGSKYFSDFLRQVKENVLSALQNQDYQFNTLTERLHIQRKLNRNALFDVSFDYHNMTLYDLEVNGLKFKSREIDSNTVSTDLILTFFEDSDKNLSGCIDFATDLFDKDTIERMAMHFMQIIRYAATNPESRIAEIPIICAQDLEIVLNQFKKTVPPEASCIQELFAQKAAQIPDEIALISADGTQNTYAELDRESYRIAHALRAEGAVAESRIGILAERTAELVIAILGVLKAGCTYIPLDATYAPERIQYMVSQCEMCGILASERYVQQASDLCRAWSLSELRKQQLSGRCAAEQKESCWAIPESGFCFQTDLYGRTDGLGQIYTKYADEILRELRYQEAHTVKDALRTGDAENSVIWNLCSLTAGYAAMKTLAALTEAPVRIEAKGDARLCAETFSETLTPAEAVKRILEEKAKPDCTGKLKLDTEGVKTVQDGV